MDRSLKGLMRINRGRFFNLPPIDIINPPAIDIINPPAIDIINPPSPTAPDVIPVAGPNPDTSTYTLSDFGENVINNHWELLELVD